MQRSYPEPSLRQDQVRSVKHGSCLVHALITNSHFDIVLYRIEHYQLPSKVVTQAPFFLTELCLGRIYGPCNLKSALQFCFESFPSFRNLIMRCYHDSTNDSQKIQELVKAINSYTGVNASKTLVGIWDVFTWRASKGSNLNPDMAETLVF